MSSKTGGNFRIEDGVLKAVFSVPGTRVEAIQLALEKWEYLASNDEDLLSGVGARTCALCTLYADATCKDCPVKEYTGAPGCVNTPHRAYCEATLGGLSPIWARGNAPASKALAKQFVTLLESVLKREIESQRSLNVST